MNVRKDRGMVEMLTFLGDTREKQFKKLKLLVKRKKHNKEFWKVSKDLFCVGGKSMQRLHLLSESSLCFFFFET